MSKKQRTPAQIAADAKRTGRPPKRPEERRNLTISVKVTQAEKDEIEKAARTAGMTTAGVMLDCFRRRRK